MRLNKKNWWNFKYYDCVIFIAIFNNNFLFYVIVLLTTIFIKKLKRLKFYTRILEYVISYNKTYVIAMLDFALYKMYLKTKIIKAIHIVVDKVKILFKNATSISF